jgi:hypothetical protein
VADQRHGVDHPISFIAVREDGLLEFRYHDGVHLRLEDAQAIVRAAAALVGEQAPLATIVYLGQVRGTTRQAREYMAYSEENQRLSSRVALVVSSRVGRMLVNLLFGLSPPLIPTRAFTDERAALEWLANPRRSGPSRHAIVDPEPDL